MISSRILSLCFFLLLFVSACSKTMVVLVPDPDGAVGKVTVTPKIGSSHLLEKPMESINTYPVSILSRGSDIITMESLPESLKETLRNEPEYLSQFIFYFQSGSVELNEESLGKVSLAVQKIEAKKSCDVVSIGHSDSVGDEEYNVRLSSQRAEVVKSMLVAAGVAAECIETISYGESDPLVKSGDNVDESVNRRVELEIR
ncbi:OmpA family protein [Desulforhopalus sp. IMCC35007]|uniref:OmpA family protein n=1 Tax=Desulforhopalus sp. IMCC35007 TaxID=2569543 RepID=UPI00145EDF70|nr:OmpA family protein [Desulforhopalus sp. IMCC35007]